MTPTQELFVQKSKLYRRCRVKFDRQFYSKTWIDRKIGTIIRCQRQIDERFYLFPEVLSEDAINKCMIDKLPRTGFSIIQEGRKWTAEGCDGFQNLLRNQWVYQKTTAEKEDNGVKQKMKFDCFYSAVAKKLAISHPSTSKDKVIMHEPSLKVYHIVVGFLFGFGPL